MPVDTAIVKSPGWWLTRLMKHLIEVQQPQVDNLDRYLSGDHPLPDVIDTAEDQRAARAFLKNARSNYLPLVVESVIERMRVIGWRTDTSDTTGDKDSQVAWKAAHLDADQTLVYRDAIGRSRGYVMVGRHPRRQGKALVTVEDPRWVTTESYLDDRREVEAGLKVFMDAYGYGRANVYLPDRVVKYRSHTPMPDRYDTQSMVGVYSEASLKSWEVIEDTGNPLGVVPIVPFLNRVSSDGRSLGEFEDVIDIQNRINQTILIRLIAEKYGALRQRAILNLAIEDDDETGDPVLPELPNTPAVTWLLDGEHVSIWESAQTDTANIMAGIVADIRDLAAITRTPPHYLLNSIVNASGDALKSAETGLVSKVRERILQMGESWEQVMRLIHLVLGRRDRFDADSPLEAIWADPESRTLSELSDAVVKQMAAGLPWRARMELLGKSPTEIDRLDAERTADAMLAALAAPPVAIGPVPAQRVPDDAEAIDAEVEDDVLT